MKRQLITLVIMLLSMAAFSQYSVKYDTVRFKRGGKIFQVITYGKDSIKINDTVYNIHWRFNGTSRIQPNPRNSVIHYPGIQEWTSTSTPAISAPVWWNASDSSLRAYGTSIPEIIDTDTITGCNTSYVVYSPVSDITLTIGDIDSICGCFTVKNMGVNSNVTIESVDGLLIDDDPSIVISYLESVVICPRDSFFYVQADKMLSADSTNDSILWTRSNSRASMWTKYSDMVGIGTVSPTVSLDVREDARVQDTLFVGTSGTGLWSPADSSLRCNNDIHADSGTFVGRTLQINEKIYASGITQAASEDSLVGWKKSTGEFIAIPKTAFMEGLYRYSAYSSGDKNVEVLATNTGITASLAGSTLSFTIPSGVRIISAKIRIEGLASLTLDMGTIDFGNTSLSDRWMPLVQSWREDTGQQLMGSTCLMDLANHDKFTIYGLISTSKCQIRLGF